MFERFFLPAASLTDMFTGFLPVVIGLLAIFISLLLFIAQRYKRCPSNRVLVIYGSVGKGKSATTVHGGGKFVWPIIQDFDYLFLEPIQIEVPLEGCSFQREHSCQRAQRVYRGHRHAAGDHAERRHPFAGFESLRHQEAS